MPSENARTAANRLVDRGRESALIILTNGAGSRPFCTHVELLSSPSTTRVYGKLLIFLKGGPKRDTNRDS